MKNYKIAIGCDHSGYPAKKTLREYLLGLGHTIKNLGIFSTQSVNYPNFPRPMAQEVANERFDLLSIMFILLSPVFSNCKLLFFNRIKHLP